MAYLACLSDLHFGEPYTLLRNDLSIYAAQMVSHLSGPRLEKLLLLGDTFEVAAPEEPDAAFPAARVFFQALTGDRVHGLAIGELRWVPGNHDHAIWSHYCEQSGVAATQQNWTLWENGEPTDDTAAHLIANLFGSAPLQMIEKITVANPIHVESLPKGQIIFHHGHLFDDLVLGVSGVQEFKAAVTNIFAGGFSLPEDPRSATDLADLERRTTAFVDSVWGRNTDRQSLKAQTWELLTRFRRWPSCTTPAPADRPQYADLGATEARALPKEADNVRAFFRKFIFPSLPANAPTALVYGHFHSGGTYALDVDGRTVQCVNAGGWITSHEGTVPHSHLVLVDEQGTITQQAIRFPDEVISESIAHGRSVRALDVADLSGADQANNTDPF